MATWNLDGEPVDDEAKAREATQPVKRRDAINEYLQARGKLDDVWHSIRSGFRIAKGPNGTIQIDQMNGVQGWHNGYLTPKDARAAGIYLIGLADEMSQEAAKP